MGFSLYFRIGQAHDWHRPCGVSPTGTEALVTCGTWFFGRSIIKLGGRVKPVFGVNGMPNKFLGMIANNQAAP